MTCTYSKEASSHPLWSPNVESSNKALGNPASTESSSPVSDISVRNDSLRDLAGVSDLALAKHYFSHTVQTMVGDNYSGSQSDVWGAFIPAAALTCSVVRHGMLTLAAMCLHYDHPTASVPSGGPLQYLEAAEAHGVIFVRESRQKMKDLSQQTDFNSCLACSRLLCVLGFAFYRKHRANGVTLADGAAWTWLQLLRGIHTTYIAAVGSGEKVDESILRDMVPELSSEDHYPWCLPSSDLGPQHQDPAFIFFQQSRQQRFDALRTVWHASWQHFGEDEAQDLSSAIDLLVEVTEHICSMDLRCLFRAVCTWPGSVSKGYVDLVSNWFSSLLLQFTRTGS